MIGQTHMAAGAAAGLLTIPLVGGVEVSLIALSLLGGLFPDFDHPNSTVSHLGFRLSRRGMKLKPFRPLAAIGALFFRHRGKTHTLAFSVLFSSVIWLIAGWSGLPVARANMLALAFWLGYTSHLLTDAMTISGVPLWWPIKPLKQSSHLLPRSWRVKTGSWTDHGLGLLCWLGVVAGLLWGMLRGNIAW